MSQSPLDAGIPVLTEVIETPAASPAEPVSAEVPAAPATLEQQAVVFDDEAWDRMERDVRERVLYQVLERIDFVLEQRVRDSLADVLQTAVERLADEIRGGLHQSVRELVTRAVAQEITKLQTGKK
ncbi:hypothetical protein E4K72_01090 [Oxalobacteraceae bacterium OM1]|nr:hypothetical protein E4K72_01090 [Oxalobacteraceae bacterium OM1]